MEIPKRPTEEASFEDPTGFRKIFQDRFNRTQPLPENEGLFEGYDYNDIGIERVIRKIPAVIFESTEKGDYDLWIQEPSQDCGKICHETLREELQDFAKDKQGLNEILYPFSSYLIIGKPNGQPGKERAYLITDKRFARVIDQECRHFAGDDFLRVWESFMKKYGIDAIVGKFEEPRSTGSVLKDYYSPKEIINCDILERIQENTDLIRAAQGRLTYHEYLRLYAHYEANRDAGKKFDFFGEVEKIVAKRKKEKEAEKEPTKVE